MPALDANTLMQRVIPAGDIEKYMDGTYIELKGYMCRAEDVMHLKTYDDIYDSLMLDYPGSEFKPHSDTSLGVIRFKTKDYSEIAIPYGPEMGGICVDRPPCTRNGFTGATNGQIIPEYKCDNLISVLDGAQLIEIELDGTEKLRAVYSDNAKKFIPVE